MSRYYSYLNSSKEIVQSYPGVTPLAPFLKKYFAERKKIGSSDRRHITQLCFGYYRLGKAVPELELTERILLGYFLSASSPDSLLEQLKPEWNAKAASSLKEKLFFLSLPDPLPIFPWTDILSQGMDLVSFQNSFLLQPDLFVRVRPGMQANVEGKLIDKAIPFRTLGTDCLAFPNLTKLDSILDIDKEVVVQDLNSQRVVSLVEGLGPFPKLWDCCAGSGGKSILFHDKYPEATITVTDIRKSILANLGQRFKRAGIRDYQLYAGDLSLPMTGKGPGKFPLIIADVPCSGAGTWSRTPEQLALIDISTLNSYADRQRKIISQVVPFLEEGGYLLYITCSVFAEENESIANYISETYSLQMIRHTLFSGYNEKADTLFAALFRKGL